MNYYENDRTPREIVVGPTNNEIANTAVRYVSAVRSRVDDLDYARLSSDLKEALRIAGPEVRDRFFGSNLAKDCFFSLFDRCRSGSERICLRYFAEELLNRQNDRNDVSPLYDLINERLGGNPGEILGRGWHGNGLEVMERVTLERTMGNLENATANVNRVITRQSFISR
ncbi:MAG: hypothetical protein LBG48_01165 [Rickettsiales bacterium]|jgi:hypothetical protein|nr:hypothetical protein [Rickettsiales bacterium]